MEREEKHRHFKIWDIWTYLGHGIGSETQTNWDIWSFLGPENEMGSEKQIIQNLGHRVSLGAQNGEWNKNISKLWTSGLTGDTKWGVKHRQLKIWDIWTSVLPRSWSPDLFGTVQDSRRICSSTSLVSIPQQPMDLPLHPDKVCPFCRQSAWTVPHWGLSPAPYICILTSFQPVTKWYCVDWWNARWFQSEFTVEMNAVFLIWYPSSSATKSSTITGFRHRHYPDLKFNTRTYYLLTLEADFLAPNDEEGSDAQLREELLPRLNLRSRCLVGQVLAIQQRPVIAWNDTRWQDCVTVFSPTCQSSVICLLPSVNHYSQSQGADTRMVCNKHCTSMFGRMHKCQSLSLKLECRYQNGV